MLNLGYYISWADLRRRMEEVYWDTFYDVENLLDYWQDDRIDHAFVSYADWADSTPIRQPSDTPGIFHRTVRKV